jgi:integrase
MHADGGRLWLQVSVGQGGGLRRSWIFRYAVGERERKMGLGSLDTIGLAEAREKAGECRQLRLQGIDPIDHRDAERRAQAVSTAKSITFKEAADRYIAAHRAGWRNIKHASQWASTLGTYAHPVLGSLPVQAIDTGLVLRVLEPIWTKKPETAARVRGRVESVLDWAAARGLRQGENPARWKGHLDKLLPRKSKVHKLKHHAALPYSEIAAFMANLRALGSTPARALEFTILTAARTCEVLGARWEEVDLKTATWTVPEARREHKVPLSRAAIAVLQAMHAVGQSGFVFPGAREGKPLYTNALSHMVRYVMGRGDLTVHGFRSTFRDWAAECTSFPREVAEMALAHAIGLRGDLFEQRGRLMAAWETACAGPDHRGKVVPIRAAQV